MIDPQTLKYASTHEWVHVEGETATIGISKFAVDQLTDLIMIDLPAVGAKLTAGKSFGEIESVKAVSDLYAPVNGTVIEVNGVVKADVQKLAADAYTDGWLIKIQLENPSDVNNLMDADAYEKQVHDQDH
jgi:glycine cleavage system H protein